MVNSPDTPPSNRPGGKPKAIRLTRAEAHAMTLVRPRRRRAGFIVGALIVAAFLGGALWHFRDWWLPYWAEQVSNLPDFNPIPLAPPAPGEPSPAPEQAPAPTPAPPADDTLAYLSAAPWDHPQFHEAVRLFNQALDHYQELPPTATAHDLVAVANEAIAAGRLFESLILETPDDFSLDSHIATVKRLVRDIRETRQNLAARPPETPPVAAATPTAPAAPSPAPAAPAAPPSYRDTPDFQKGAHLFNQALEHFNAFKHNPGQLDRLDTAEDLANQAAKTFEALKPQTDPARHAELDRLIHQCYGMVSACRGARLAGNPRSGDAPSARRKAGPRRRPPLPAPAP